jgi:sugar diacid utilization regulator
VLNAITTENGPIRAAELAAEQLGGSVAIILPPFDIAVVSPSCEEPHLHALRQRAKDRMLGQVSEGAPPVSAEVPIRSGDDIVGTASLLDGEANGDVERILQLAVLAVVTTLSLEKHHGQSRRQARAELVLDIHRSSSLRTSEILARGHSVGAVLERGAAALCVGSDATTAANVISSISHYVPTALAGHTGDHVIALLPSDRDRSPQRTYESARHIARLLQLHGRVGLSPFEGTTAALHVALRVAELTMLVAVAEDLEIDAVTSGAWRPLVRLGVLEPREIDALVTSSVGPLVEQNVRSSLGLIETLTSYLANGASMRRTADSVNAHRHTVAYRLERIGELTGHNPLATEGQQQLALGLKALSVKLAAQRGDPPLCR